MGNDGQIQLADFGWAVHAPQPFHRRRTFCGTQDYLSPELVENKEYSHWVDNWSLGVLIYEFVMGQSPFHSEVQPTAFSCFKDEVFSSINHSSLGVLYVESIAYVRKDSRSAICVREISKHGASWLFCLFDRSRRLLMDDMLMMDRFDESIFVSQEVRDLIAGLLRYVPGKKANCKLEDVHFTAAFLFNMPRV